MKRFITRAALFLSGTLLQAVAGCPGIDEIITFQGFMYGTRSPLTERDWFVA
jgi:hypothetical protein